MASTLPRRATPECSPDVDPAPLLKNQGVVFPCDHVLVQVLGALSDDPCLYQNQPHSASAADSLELGDSAREIGFLRDRPGCRLASGL